MSFPSVVYKMPPKYSFSSSPRPAFLQLLVHREDKGRAWYGTAHGDAAATVHSLQAVLLPERFAHGAESGLAAGKLLDVFSLHARLDRICWEEHEVVGGASHRS